MGLVIRDIGGAKVWSDDQKPWKIYDGIGEGVRAWKLRPGLPADDTTNTPTEVIVTATGTSPLTVGVAAGYPLLASTGTTEYNGLNIQLRGESAKLAAGKQVFLRGKIKPNADTTMDLLFGLAELKTDLMKTSAAHGVNTAVTGVFLVKVSSATVKELVLEAHVAGVKTASVAIGDLAKDVDNDLALWWDGDKLRVYLNDAEKASISSGLPTSELTPSINLRAGAAAAVTCGIAELAFVNVE
jgi:hypothetical protein